MPLTFEANPFLWTRESNCGTCTHVCSRPLPNLSQKCNSTTLDQSIKKSLKQTYSLRSDHETNNKND